MRNFSILLAATTWLSLSATLFGQGSAPRPKSPVVHNLLMQREEVLSAIQDNDAHLLSLLRLVEQSKHLAARARQAGNGAEAATAAQALENAEQGIELVQHKLARERAILWQINSALDQAREWPPDLVAVHPAATPIGMTGTVKITNAQGHAIALHGQGFKLQPGMTIDLPGRHSFMRLQLPSGARVDLGPHTRLRYEAGKTDRIYDLLQGELHLNERAKAYLHKKFGSRFSIRTPQVAVAVRGTEFTISTNSRRSVFTVLSGEIALRVNGRKAPIILRRMQWLRIPTHGAIPSPAAISGSHMQVWWQP